MRYNNYSAKNKNYKNIKKRNYTRKYIGGTNGLSNANSLQNENILIDENNINKSNSKNNKNIIMDNNINNNLSQIENIKKKIQSEDSFKNLLPNINLGDSKILDKATDLAEGLGVKTLEKAGNLVGIDITNPQQTNQKLEQIRKTLTNPENINKIKEITSNIAEIGAVGIEASKPFITPLINTTVEKIKEAGSEVGEAAVKIALNTAEEIPGVGILVGTVRNLSNAGEAGLAAINAGSEIIKTTSDSINAATKNFNRLIKEKGELLNRTQNSINNFMNPLNYQNKVPNVRGGSKKSKKIIKKTKKNKKVYFNV
jgi:hypothetical protein